MAASEHLSLRLDPEMLKRLDAWTARTGESRSHLVKTLLEEGLRMEEHPGIVFRSGPVGRRPGLSCGPDVWEIVSVVRGLESEGEDLIQDAVDLTGQPAAHVRRAFRYYAQYRDEIDAWIRRGDEEAERAERAWRQQQERLHA